MTTTDSSSTTPVKSGWNIGLWVAQIVLAAIYGMAAYMKLLMAPDALVQMGLLWVDGAPVWLVRAIGFAELLGAIGLILPTATRIKPELTTLAALGLLVIQVLAIGLHVYRGEFATLPFNAIYLALSALVLWGRTRKAPIAPRS
ncbi:MAG: DoxX family protein [Roseibium sp.]